MRRRILVLASVVVTLTLGDAALAAPGDITLASSSDSGVQGNYESRAADMSADGRRVAFESKATNLDPLDTDLSPDIYVKDLASGEVVLASVAPARHRGRGKANQPRKGNGYSLRPSLSADGTRVAFDTGSYNLLPDDPTGDLDIYVKDLVTGELLLASTATDGTKANGYSARASISDDGTKVAFQSTATNLDPADGDPTYDVYVKDLVTGSVSLASVTAGGTKGNSYSFSPAISPDGTMVAFASQATNLDPADTDSITGLYVKDLLTGELFLASASDQGVSGDGASFGASLSRDGRMVAFTSQATNLDPGDGQAGEDVYVKDLASGDLALVSTAENGTKGNGVSHLGSISADGRLVAFDSVSTNLDAADQDNIDDVFLKDLAAGGVTLLSVRADGVKGDGHSGAASSSADATRVAFGSGATNLYPQASGRTQILVKER